MAAGEYVPCATINAYVVGVTIIPCAGLSPLATGATAGTPGVWTPPGSVPPETGPGMGVAGIAATPATAWTDGQYVVVGDGEHTFWDGAYWESGEA